MDAKKDLTELLEVLGVSHSMQFGCRMKVGGDGIIHIFPGTSIDEGTELTRFKEVEESREHSMVEIIKKLRLADVSFKRDKRRMDKIGFFISGGNVINEEHSDPGSEYLVME
eukprot:159522-Ditylum_brightwellii.AAC.1